MSARSKKNEEGVKERKQKFSVYRHTKANRIMSVVPIPSLSSVDVPAILRTERSRSDQGRGVFSSGDFEEDMVNYCLQKNVESLPVVKLLPTSRLSCKPRAMSTADVEISSVNNQRLTGTGRQFMVDYEEAADAKSVNEIYIRNWSVDKAIMEGLQACCPSLRSLRLLHLCNADVKPDTLRVLADFAPRCRSLTTLFLDGNSALQNADLSRLLGPESRLQELSLRFCQLSDLNACALGSALGTSRGWNATLRHLSLANNRISDQGAQYLANALMTNRDLLVLNLAGNSIGDVGAAALAEVLNRFTLSAEQMNIRRNLLSEFDRKLRRITKVVTKQDHVSSLKLQSPVRPERLAISSLSKKKKTEPDGMKKGGQRADTTGPGPQARSRSRQGSWGGGIGGGEGKRLTRPTPLLGVPDRQIPRNSVSGLLQEHPLGSEPEPINDYPRHPLCDVLIGVGQEQQLVGNRMLRSLNLSRNRIGKYGMVKLLEMLKDQAAYQEHRQSGRGLLRLVVQKNAVPADCRIVQNILERVALRDPMRRVPLLTLQRRGVSACAIPPIPI